MCLLQECGAYFAEDKCTAGVFEKIICLIGDWEHDEKPSSLDELVSEESFLSA